MERKKEIPKLVPDASVLAISNDMKTPAEVLRVQAKYWEEMTNGEVLGEVEPALSAPDRFAYWFAFVVPELGSAGGYRYRVFLVDHGLSQYPLLIKKSPADATPITVADEQAYYEQLKIQFGSEQTIGIVKQLRTLVAEARAARRPEQA